MQPIAGQKTTTCQILTKVRPSEFARTRIKLTNFVWKHIQAVRRRTRIAKELRSFHEASTAKDVVMLEGRN